MIESGSLVHVVGFIPSTNSSPIQIIFSEADRRIFAVAKSPLGRMVQIDRCRWQLEVTDSPLDRWCFEHINEKNIHQYFATLVEDGGQYTLKLKRYVSVREGTLFLERGQYFFKKANSESGTPQYLSLLKKALYHFNLAKRGGALLPEETVAKIDFEIQRSKCLLFIERFFSQHHAFLRESLCSLVNTIPKGPEPFHRALIDHCHRLMLEGDELQLYFLIGYANEVQGNYSQAAQAYHSLAVFAIDGTYFLGLQAMQRALKLALMGNDEQNKSEITIKHDLLGLELDKVLVSIRSAALKSPSCFISFALEEPGLQEWLSERLKPDLEKVGIKVVFSSHSLNIGSDLIDFETEEISEADNVLLCLTPLYKKNASRPTAKGLALEVETIASRFENEAKENFLFPAIMRGPRLSVYPAKLLPAKNQLAVDFRDPSHYSDSLIRLACSQVGIPAKRTYELRMQYRTVAKKIISGGYNVNKDEWVRWKDSEPPVKSRVLQWKGLSDTLDQENLSTFSRVYAGILPFTNPAQLSLRNTLRRTPSNDSIEVAAFLESPSITDFIPQYQAKVARFEDSLNLSLRIADVLNNFPTVDPNAALRFFTKMTHYFLHISGPSEVFAHFLKESKAWSGNHDNTPLLQNHLLEVEGLGLRASGDYSLAIRKFNEAIERYEKMSDEEFVDPTLAPWKHSRLYHTSCVKLFRGVTWMKNARSGHENSLRYAMEDFLGAKQGLEVLFPEGHFHQVRAIRNIVECQVKQGVSLCEATPLLEQAVVMQETIYGEDYDHHPTAAATLCSLGRIYKQRQLLTIASQTYKKALAINERVYGLCHPYVLRVRQELEAISEMEPYPKL